MERGAWWATIHWVAKSLTRLSDFTFTFTVYIYHIQPNDLTYIHHEMITTISFSVAIQLLSCNCLTLCNSLDCSMPGFPVLHYHPELAQTQVHHWVYDAIQPSQSLSLHFLPALYLSQHQGLFQWTGALHQLAKYWSLSFTISPSNEYSGLISLRVDWFDLLAVQQTLKSPL